MNKNYTIREFADELKVSHDTVTRWVRSGKVKGSKVGLFPGKTTPISIPGSELVRLKKMMDGKAQR